MPATFLKRGQDNARRASQASRAREQRSALKPAGSLLGLPDEVIAGANGVVAMLPMTSLTAVSSVCKRMHQLVQHGDHWRQRLLSMKPDEEAVSGCGGPGEAVKLLWTRRRMAECARMLRSMLSWRQLFVNRALQKAALALRVEVEAEVDGVLWPVDRIREGRAAQARPTAAPPRVVAGARLFETALAVRLHVPPSAAARGLRHVRIYARSHRLHRRRLVACANLAIPRPACAACADASDDKGTVALLCLPCTAPVADSGAVPAAASAAAAVAAAPVGSCVALGVWSESDEVAFMFASVHIADLWRSMAVERPTRPPQLRVPDDATVACVQVTLRSLVTDLWSSVFAIVPPTTGEAPADAAAAGTAVARRGRVGIAHCTLPAPGRFRLHWLIKPADSARDGYPDVLRGSPRMHWRTPAFSGTLDRSVFVDVTVWGTRGDCAGVDVLWHFSRALPLVDAGGADDDVAMDHARVAGTRRALRHWDERGHFGLELVAKQAAGGKCERAVHSAWVELR